MSGSVDVSDHEITRGLADDLSVGVWVARAPNGEFVYANRMFAEIMSRWFANAEISAPSCSIS